MRHSPVQLAASKAVESAVDWAVTTVRTGEANSGRWSNTNDFSAMIARATAWVYICADINAMTCASKVLRMYRPTKGKKVRKGARAVDKRRVKHLKSVDGVGIKASQYAEYADDIEEVTDHPALMLLRKPNPYYVGMDFFRLRQWYKEVCGNDFQMVICEGGSDPTALYPMMPQYTRIVPHPEVFIAGYTYGREESRREFFGYSEVIHTKFAASPFNPYNGIGPLFSVIAEADLDSAATESEKSTWLNGARPDFVAALPEGATGEQVKQYTANINANHRGPKNKGRFLVTTQATIEPLSWSMREMEYLAGKENIRERILAAYGVPESRVKMNDANLASSKTGDLQYMRDTIRPRLIQDAEEWTEHLLPMFGEEPGDLWFAYDNCVPQDEPGVIAKFTAKIITTNEARAELDYEPFDDPAADMLGGVDMEAERESRMALAQVSAQNNASNADQMKSANAELMNSIAGIVGKAIEKLESPNVVASDAVVKSIVDATVKAMEDQAEPPPETVEQHIQRTCEAFLKSIAPDIAQRASLHPSVPIEQTVVSTGFIQRMKQAITPSLNRGFSSGWRDGAAEVDGVKKKDVQGSLVGSFDLASPDARRFLDDYTFKLCQRTAQTVAGNLEATLQAALQTGVSIPELQKLLFEQMDSATPYMAERIGRTEASRAFNTGKEASWIQSGVVEAKEWLLGGEPCPICTAMAERFNRADLQSNFLDFGQSFDYVDDEGNNKTFTADYSDILTPPCHPNCVCSVGAIFKDDEP